MLKKKVNEKLTFDLPNLEYFLPSFLYNLLSRLIYNDLVQSIEEDPDKNKDLVCERIREMTEFQLWGEKNNDLFFE